MFLLHLCPSSYREKFQEGIAKDEFLEHAEVHGEHYGTSTWAVAKVCAMGKIAVMDIDVQGATKVRMCAWQRWR